MSTTLLPQLFFRVSGNSPVLADGFRRERREGQGRNEGGLSVCEVHRPAESARLTEARAKRTENLLLAAGLGRRKINTTYD